MPANNADASSLKKPLRFRGGFLFADSAMNPRAVKQSPALRNSAGNPPYRPNAIFRKDDHFPEHPFFASQS
jgi:hypothetical protein